MTDSNKLKRRRFLEATGAAAGAAALAGCTGPSETSPTEGDGGATPTDDGDGDATPTDTQEVQKGGTFKLINSTMENLDPIAQADTASGRVIGQCYEALMTYPDGHKDPVKNLATGYEASSDYTTYTFTLKEGVQFQNVDKELQAEDVVYSWERLAASPVSERAYFILSSMNVAHETSEGSYEPGSMELSATGDYEVEFTLARPFHATLQMLAYSAFGIVPKGIVGAQENLSTKPTERPGGTVAYKKFANSATYGTGPFDVDFWNKGKDVQVSKNDNYHVEGQPYLDKIHWQIIEKPDPSYRYSTNGNSDLLSIPTQYYDPKKVSVERTTDTGAQFGTYGPLESGSASGETVNWMKQPEIATYYIAFDVSNTPRAVRKAMAYVVNRAEISNSVFKQRLPPGYHLTPPAIYPGGASAYEEHVQNEYPYGIEDTDIESAKQVMEEAGYGPDNKYNLTINSYQGIFTELVRGVRDKLSTAHVNVKVEPTDFATIIQKGKQGNLQCYTLGWIADWPAPDNFLQLIAPQYTDVAELGASALTYTNWSEVDTEYSQAAKDAWDTISSNLQPTESARQARAEAYVQMEEANWNEVVLINLVHGAGERFWWDYVHVDPFGSMGSSRQTHDTTWVDK